MKGLAFILAFFCAVFANAQNWGDCAGAKEITTRASIDQVEGYGEKLEIKGYELGNAKYITEEHNTVWLKFTAPYDAKLSFELLPKNPKDDWDFMLFSAGVADCPSIRSGENQPVRSNLARNNLQEEGKTGLHISAKNDFVPARVNPNMSNPLDVKMGDTFLLLIDNNQTQRSGFTLHLDFQEMEEFNVEAAPAASDFGFVDMTEEVTDESQIEINFEVLLEGTTQPIECHAEIIGVMWSDTNLVYDDVSGFKASLPKDKWFFVNVKKEGYTFGTEKYKATEEMDGTTHTIYVNPVQAGAHIVLTEIVFRENTTHLLPSSVNALEQLIGFMNEYPSAEIDIQGHVNAPGYDNDGKVKRLSQKRADQIKEYLVAEGVEGRRIKTTGMGNEFMVFPNPKTYDQEKANRRVEVVITAL